MKQLFYRIWARVFSSEAPGPTVPVVPALTTKAYYPYLDHKNVPALRFHVQP